MRSSRLVRLLLSPVAFLVACDARPQLPFDLDTTFRTEINSWYVSSILPQADGKTIVSGQIKFPGDLSFRSGTRLNTDGSLDPTFAYPAYMGGKLLAWNGKVYQRNGHLVRRSWPDGTLDPTFIMMNNGPYFSSLQGGDYHVYPDGRILMSGVHVLSDSIRGFEGLYCLIWFSNTGYLDTTKTHRTCAGSLDFFRELPSGQFIGSGSTNTWDGQPASNIVRFDADGELDPTFQANVWWGQAYGFLPLADGRVYAAGLFRIAGISDTLNLVRFMPDGSLDPSFNNHLDFRITEMTNFEDGPVIRSITELDEGRLVVTGQFELIEGEDRRNICLIDTSGNLVDDYFWGPGCGNFTYQGETRSSIGGIAPALDWSYYIWGGYHGYDDGTTNDTQQRMVSRLYGLNVGLQESPAQAITLRLSPNPGSEFVDIDPGGSLNGDIVLRDLQGRIVCFERLQSSQHRLATGQLAQGTYIVELHADGLAPARAKWIKQ